ncbi:hypothetical protein M2392_004200 [Pseudomonas grimontii]|nr:hypothetical protein [Pseudomonas grimontii]
MRYVSEKWLAGVFAATTTGHRTASSLKHQVLRAPQQSFVITPIDSTLTKPAC